LLFRGFMAIVMKFWPPEWRNGTNSYFAAAGLFSTDASVSKNEEASAYGIIRLVAARSGPRGRAAHSFVDICTVKISRAAILK
jgi:hypothetical protein